MSENEALQKTQDSMIAEISPFMAQSLDLKAKAEAQLVTDEQSLASAVAVKKQITAHRTQVQSTRLSITRRFDAVKKAIMSKEDEILLPLDEAQNALGEKILTYQEEQERIRREEQERVDKIVARVTVGDIYRFKDVDAVQDEGERFKKLYSELKPEDQKHPDVKLAFTQSINKLADRRQYLIDQEERRKEDERLAAERKKQSDERAKLEAEKAEVERKKRQIEADKERLEREKQRKADEDAAAEAKAKRDAEDRTRVKTGARTITKFEVEDPTAVPREFCEPSEKLIRAAIANGQQVPGVRTWQERKV